MKCRNRKLNKSVEKKFTDMERARLLKLNKLAQPIVIAVAIIIGMINFIQDYSTEI